MPHFVFLLNISEKELRSVFQALTLVSRPAAFERHCDDIDSQHGIWLHMLSSIAPIAPFSPASLMLLDSIVLQTERPSSWTCYFV